MDPVSVSTKPTTESPTTASSTTSAIALAQRLPSFWTDQPELWFLQLEATLASAKLTDDHFSQVVLTLLGKEQLELLADILRKPPSTDKFQTIKKRLLSSYSESNAARTRRLWSVALNDKRPSHLLRHIQLLAKTDLSEDAIKNLWLSRLPPLTAASCATEIASLDELARKADTIFDTCATTTPPPTVAASSGLQSVQPTQQLLDEIASIKNQLQDLLKVTPRKNSNSVKKPPTRISSPLCYYHSRFGRAARNCRPPCRFSKSGNDE